MSARSRNEGDAHFWAKMGLVFAYSNDEWSAWPECGNADVVVLHLKSKLLAAIEAESTPKHVLNNIKRNLDNGCEAVAVVTLDWRFHNQIINKVERRFPDSRNSIQVFRYNQRGYLELREWLNERAAAKERQHTSHPNHFLNNHKPKEKNQ